MREYDPHVVVVWPTPSTVAAQVYPCREDAEEKYNEIVQLRVQKVVLAKIIKADGEG
jgi:hypothetical protein